MSHLSLLLTHPGGAHKDEFLACCVLLAEHPVTLLRREPTEADLEDPSVAVIDVGHRHQPERLNFDHHQFPPDHPPLCALSLVLQHLGLYDDARAFCDWLQPAEWFDCLGPNETARRLGVPRAAVNQLHSPLDGTLLRAFAQTSRLDPGQPLWEIMRLVGADLLGYVRHLRTRLNFIAQHAQRWSLDPHTDAGNLLFLPRTEPLPDDPSAGLDRHLASLGLTDHMVGLIYPDRRGPGYGLTRFRDHPQLDFTRIAAEPDVHFAHARGFVAKTSATDPARLLTLLRLASTPAS